MNTEGEAPQKKLGGITGKGFMPGQSGNPSGRPSRRLMTERYQGLMEQPLPEELKVALKLQPGATYGDAIVLAQARAALKGKTEAAREITDRVDGKARQQVEVSGRNGGPVDLYELLAEARKRVANAELKKDDP